MVELKGDMVGLKGDMVELKGDMVSVKDALLVPEGDKESTRLAVAIKPGSESPDNEILGHGALLRMSVKDEDKYEYYLLSAAHVVVDVFGSEEKIFIEHTFRSPENPNTIGFNCRARELYISREYIKHGLKDFGFVKIEDIEWENEESNLFESEFLLKKVELGKSVVAHGKVFLRGTVTSTLNGRFSVQAHSVPGQSGSLLLDNKKQVAGVVHGSSKHCGKHTNADQQDASVVYCDHVELTNLVRVDGSKENCRLLRLAEFIPQSVASGSQAFCDWIEELNSETWFGLIEDFRLNPKKATLAEVMKKFADKVVPDDENHPSISFENVKVIHFEEIC